LAPVTAQLCLKEPNEMMPKLIAGWIFQKCEKPDVKDPSTADCEGCSFSHALKMRAAISYHYAQEEGTGSEKWHQDRQGTWLGNPALSHGVSRYMLSLHRRKVSKISSEMTLHKLRVSFTSAVKAFANTFAVD
jgi:hypothetical protein